MQTQSIDFYEVPTGRLFVASPVEPRRPNHSARSNHGEVGIYDAADGVFGFANKTQQKVTVQRWRGDEILCC